MSQLITETAGPQTELTAKVFRGLGDPNRLQILEHLLVKDRSVSELVELLGAPQGRVSNHLACLRWCGFVAAERRGRYLFYRVTDDRVRELIAMAKAMLADNAKHIFACTRIEG